MSKNSTSTEDTKDLAKVGLCRTFMASEALLSKHVPCLQRSKETTSAETTAEGKKATNTGRTSGETATNEKTADKTTSKEPSNQRSPEKGKQSGEEADGETKSTRARRMYGPRDMVKVFIPVSICMLIVVVCVRNVEIFKTDHVLPTPYVLYREVEVEPTTKLWQSGLNAAFLMAIIIIVTLLIVGLFYFKCYLKCALFRGKVSSKSLTFTFSVSIRVHYVRNVHAANYCIVFSILVSRAYVTDFSITLNPTERTPYSLILRELDVPVSSVTFLFVLYNMAILAMLCIFWKGPMKVQQVSVYYFMKYIGTDSRVPWFNLWRITLIIISAMVALTIMVILPQWTCWVLLIVLALWDLFAVLTPCGPLKILVEIAEKRGEDLMPALIYTGSVSEGGNSQVSTQKTQTDDENANKPEPGVESLRVPNFAKSQEEEERNIRLGLGDFIFYSLLVGTAAKNGDWTTTMACYVAILTGLGFTLTIDRVANHTDELILEIRQTLNGTTYVLNDLGDAVAMLLDQLYLLLIWTLIFLVPILCISIMLCGIACLLRSTRRPVRYIPHYPHIPIVREDYNSSKVFREAEEDETIE
ncbi:unnamed protein product [Nippostrongylus brasiliensis]|uniref:Presenilin hop-1 (inferred by orthology to a C. elegans protein) n=1 Tax=Nippostrongylus brasiliensis TaxID=27835 RepID=A0A158QYA4_NIPBR|nr:unnamed protein product [Nippostrongylus brasiliensis]